MKDNSLLTTISVDEPHREQKPQRNLAQKLVQEILQKIESKVLVPGDKLPKEADIMQEHGVSRTVVREALQRLQASGNVETKHGIGTFVLNNKGQGPMDLSFDYVNDAVEILELRIGLEVEIAGLAALRRTDEQLVEIRKALDALRAIDRNGHVSDAGSADFNFHLLIAKSAGNHYFVDIMQHMENSLVPRKRIDVSHVNHEHEEVYTAIERGDSYAARAAMRLHLTNSRERFLKLARK
ncbi:FadR/GntR family transcriptional regulator [Marinomonas foliarum]|uniref:GntR family transcriptional regulator n=1 Tax=Marinomonas foliarum TaxID=491950 RepID=A0A369ADJ5_9GAMM|nr:FadR/GntR family transcriptional regulator [Marinomonas foliarum]RCX07251.1 GntR family transcriptional regulator [Marinomonas foliarum]